MYNSPPSYTPPFCASPQSIGTGIAPSYRPWLTVQPHSSHSQASGSHACRARHLTACTHVPIKTRTNWSSPAHYNIASCVWLCLVMTDFCFRSRICLVRVDRSASTFPRRAMCGNWWLLLFYSASKTHGKLHLPHFCVSYFFLSKIQLEWSLLGDYSSCLFDVLPHTVMPWAQSCILLQLQDK